MVISACLWVKVKVTFSPNLRMVHEKSSQSYPLFIGKMYFSGFCPQESRLVDESSLPSYPLFIGKYMFRPLSAGITIGG